MSMSQKSESIVFKIVSKWSPFHLKSGLQWRLFLVSQLVTIPEVKKNFSLHNKCIRDDLQKKSKLRDFDLKGR